MESLIAIAIVGVGLFLLALPTLIDDHRKARERRTSKRG